MNNRLILEKVAYKFPNKQEYLFKDVSLAISQGEIKAIVGNSGSGKSTLAKILGGYEKPNLGNAYINNIEHQISQPNCSVMTVFQDYKLAVFPWLNVRKNIELGQYKTNQLSTIDIESLTQMLFADYESGKILDILDKYPNQLSGGQIQRIQIARAIYSKSTFIIFDEADSSLDIKNKERIKSILKLINKKYSFGIIFITHDIDYAIRLSNEVIVLSQGSISTYTVTRDEKGDLLDDCNIQIKEAIFNNLNLNNSNEKKS